MIYTLQKEHIEKYPLLTKNEEASLLHFLVNKIISGKEAALDTSKVRFSQNIVDEAISSLSCISSLTARDILDQISSFPVNSNLLENEIEILPGAISVYDEDGKRRTFFDKESDMIPGIKKRAGMAPIALDRTDRSFYKLAFCFQEEVGKEKMAQILKKIGLSDEEIAFLQYKIS